MPALRTRTRAERSAQPAVGSRVSVMATTAPARVAAGSVRSWARSRSGLVVTAAVGVSRAACAALDGTTVWVSARTAGGGDLVVLAATATALPPDGLALVGVADLVLETRRAAARARLAGDVTLRLPGLRAGDRLWSASLVDLSRDGCRLRLDGRPPLSEDDAVRLDVRLRDGQRLRVPGRVLRSDPGRGEVVVVFDGLDTAGRRRLDFEVLRALDACAVA